MWSLNPQSDYPESATGVLDCRRDNGPGVERRDNGPSVGPRAQPTLLLWLETTGVGSLEKLQTEINQLKQRHSNCVNI